MNFKLERFDCNESRTIGRLYCGSEFLCYTLEDPMREVKVPGETAIPLGLFELVITMSNRFKCLMPLIKDVPGFEGIRIHWGNKAVDTDGCPLVGMNLAKDSITQSKVAYEYVFKRLVAERKKGPVFIDVCLAKASN